jgi:hypothetical protein
MIKDRTLLGLTLALAVLLADVAVFPHWLAFLVMVSLARGLVVLGLVLQMRAGLVSFGQPLLLHRRLRRRHARQSLWRP